MRETIKLGRREVDKEEFIQAVKNARTLPDICRAIGFNETVVSTKQNIRDMVIELGLDYSHINNFNWKPSEELLQKKVKQFNLSEDNKQYYDSFLSSLSEKSVATYKASCGNFLEFLNEQDFITSTKEQILDYANGRVNMIAHLRSMMTYCIVNNINSAVDKVDKQMLIWLITN